MSNYVERICKAKTKKELDDIQYQAFLTETSTTFNKVLDLCNKREQEISDRG